MYCYWYGYAWIVNNTFFQPISFFKIERSHESIRIGDMQDTILYLTSIWNMIAKNMHWKNDPMNKRILRWAANWEEIGRIFYVCIFCTTLLNHSSYHLCKSAPRLVLLYIKIYQSSLLMEVSDSSNIHKGGK